MSKSWRDKPQNEREIVVKKAKRGDHRRLEPYHRNHFVYGRGDEEDLV